MKKIKLILSTVCISLALSFSYAGQGGTPGLLFSPDAEVTEFNASSDGAETSIHWKTGMEMGVNAYRVTSEDVNGAAQTVGLVRARLGEQNEYTLAEPAAQVGDTLRYNLFIISNYGESQVAHWEGVIEIVEEEPAPIAMAAAATVEESIPVSERKCWIGNVDRVKNWTNAVPADRIRFSLTEEGVYKVTAREIADAGGWDFDAVTNALTTTNFAMSCQGEDIAWHPLDDGLIFYGVEPESRWAPENVYWIEFGSGQNMALTDGTPPENGTTNQWFMDEVFYQGVDYLSRVSFSALADAPVSYLSDSFLQPGYSSQTDVEIVNSYTGAWTGSITVDLVSAYENYGEDIDTHTGRVTIGTTSVGEPVWVGEKYVTYTYPYSSTNVASDSALVAVENIAVSAPYPYNEYGRFFLTSFQISYGRCYKANSEELQCHGGINDIVFASGFSTNDILVLKTSESQLAEIVESADILLDDVSSNYCVVFHDPETNGVYSLNSRGSGLRFPSIRGVEDVEWAASDQSAEYVMLLPPEGWIGGFREPIETLAGYRRAQGMHVRVVDVESLYNEFSYGLVDPAAISAFCVSGISNWVDQPLQYLLLAGDGGLDFKHDKFSVGDYVSCLIPSIISGQSFSGGEGMTVVMDQAFGDVDGDNIPDVSIGRFPTSDPEEVVGIVDKTMAFEGALQREDGSLAKTYALVAPDWDNDPTTSSYYQFDESVDRFIPTLESLGYVHVSCRADNPDYPNDLYTVRTNAILPALEAGSGIFHFFGHSSKSRIGYNGYYNGLPGSNFLKYSNEIESGLWSIPPIAIWIGCQINVWQYMTTSDTLIVDGVNVPNTGFVAGLGASGYLLTDEGEELGVHIYAAMEEEGPTRLGDLIRLATKRLAEHSLNSNRLPYPERDGLRSRLLCFGLSGDPALVFRHDVTAMGTDVNWLVEHGQTNANADVADVDGDGWATWEEYQYDTNPTGNVLQVVGGEMDTASGVPMIAFETTSTSSYQLEYTPSLHVSNGWTAVSWSTDGINWNPAETNIIPSGPVESIRMPASTITTQGFFRVRTVNEL